MRDFGHDAQRAAEAHLEACREAYWSEQWEEGASPVESPASAPYDDCDTCIVREVLWAAWEVIDAYLADQTRDLPPPLSDQPRDLPLPLRGLVGIGDLVLGVSTRIATWVRRDG